MRNILKGFLEPKAETYILPNTDDIRMDGEEEFIPLVPEEEEEGFYTREDFLALCNGQEDIAEMIFAEVDWQHPEAYFEEQFQCGELGLCQSCGKIFMSYGVDYCPYCGAGRGEE